MSVLILSSDKLLADALCLELKLAGIEAKIAESMDEMESRLVLCDLDSATPPPDAITLTADREKNADFHRPFLTSELVAAVRHRMAASGLTHPSPQKELKADKLRISNGKALIGDREIPLSATEAALLSLLASRPNTPISREEIARTVWGEDCLDTNRCEVYIRYLREKLEQPDTPRRIITIRGIGYMLRSN